MHEIDRDVPSSRGDNRRAARGCAAVLVLAVAATLAAQPVLETGDALRPIRFENLTNVDGLSQVSAFAVVEDSLGFIWIGTEDGLNRYDGIGFQILRHNPDAPDSSPLEGAIEALHVDRAGKLWIGMRAGGFSSFDPATGDFRHFLQGADVDNLSSYEVRCIAEDRAGNVWIGTHGGGLLRVDPDSGLLTRYPHQEGDANVRGHEVVEAIAETGDGLWIGTDGGLDQFEPATGTFKPSP